MSKGEVPHAARAPRGRRRAEEDIDRADADGTLGLLADRPDDPRRPGSSVHAGRGRGAQRARRGRGTLLAGARLDRPAARRGRSSATSTSRCCGSSTRCSQLGLIEKDVALQMARVIGSSISRIASAQIDAIETRIDEPVLEDGTEPAVLRAVSCCRRCRASSSTRGGVTCRSRRDAGWCARRARRARRR